MLECCAICNCEGIFAVCRWGVGGKSEVFCYECHEDLLHNPVLNPPDLARFAELVHIRGLSEEQKSEDRTLLAGRVKLLQEVFARGLASILADERVDEYSGRSRSLRNDGHGDSDAPLASRDAFDTSRTAPDASAAVDHRRNTFGSLAMTKLFETADAALRRAQFAFGRHEAARQAYLKGDIYLEHVAAELAFDEACNAVDAARPYF